MSESEFGSTRVADLEPLQGMKLTSLWARGTPVTNLSSLAGMPLQILECDFNLDRDADVLRSLKSLKSINGKPAPQFWEEFKNKSAESSKMKAGR